VIVNMHEAKSNLSKLVARAVAGDDIVIGRNGTPVARIVPYVQTRPERRPGRLKGKVSMATDFDDTPAWLIEAFEADL
jgi:prevent-host-death family protein